MPYSLPISEETLTPPAPPVTPELLGTRLRAVTENGSHILTQPASAFQPRSQIKQDYPFDDLKNAFNAGKRPISPSGLTDRPRKRQATPHSSLAGSLSVLPLECDSSVETEQMCGIDQIDQSWPSSDLPEEGTTNATSSKERRIVNIPARSRPRSSGEIDQCTQLDFEAEGDVESFRNAHDFTVENSRFYNIMTLIETQNIYNINNDSFDALAWLKQYIMPGADYDSEERDPPPRCHLETRTSVLERTNSWIESSQHVKRGLWIKGPAGVGKTAIVQTFVETMAESQRLGASLFFSKPNKRSNTQKIFPTIAYQLATLDLEYREHITNLRRRDPRSLEKAISKQFQLLFVEPFVKQQIRAGQHDLVIAIDGLEECDGDPGQDGSDPGRHRRRSVEEIHHELVRLIGNFLRKYPSVPLIWVIASRPEAHLKAVFSSNDVKNGFIEEDIPIDSEESHHDVERFLRASFSKIQEDYPEYFTGMPWPTPEEFSQITEAASGLFLFAAVVVRYIRDSPVGNPTAQLKYVLSAISKLNPAQLKTKPFASLDAIYTAILAKIPSETLDNTKMLLLLLVVAHPRAEDLRFKDMYERASLSREDTIAALRLLHSVIYFPTGTITDDARPQFYHTSFREFLEDPSRSGLYSICAGSFDRAWLFNAQIQMSDRTSV